MTRREFLRRALLFGLGVGALAHHRAGSLIESVAEAAGRPRPVIAVAGGRDVAGRVRAAVEALGGIGRFVKRGSTVVIKPNMAWLRKPEAAANTNPEVVAELVRLCRAAGAREVKVMDNPVDGPGDRVAEMSGIAEAARRAGAKVIVATSPTLYQRLRIRRGKVLKETQTLRDVLRADVLINVPIAKVHGSTRVTLGCKNLMGTVLDRGAWHQSESLDQCIADYVSQVRPHLTVLDATRVLLTNGPKGPGKTRKANLIVAGTDPVAVDAFGVTLLDLKPGQIDHLRRAASLGVGEIDLDRVIVKRV